MTEQERQAAKNAEQIESVEPAEQLVSTESTRLTESTDSAESVQHEELFEEPVRTTSGGDWMDGGNGESAKAFFPTLKKLAKLLRPHRLGMTVVTLIVVASVALSVLGPRVLGFAMDEIFRGVVGKHLPAGSSAAELAEQLRANGQDNLAEMLLTGGIEPGKGIDFVVLTQLLIWVVLIYLAANLLMYVSGLILNRISMAVVYKLRRDIEAKLNRIPLGYYDSRQRGDIISRVTNDVDNVQVIVQQVFSTLVQIGLSVIGIGVIMFVLSWEMALLALVALPLTGIIIGVIGVRTQKLFKQQWAATGSLTGHIEESFSGREVARIFNRQEEFARVFDERNQQLYGAASKAQFLAGTMMPAAQFVNYIVYVLIAVAGALKVASGQITLGTVTSFIQYSSEFSRPIGEFAGVVNQLQSGVASAERIFELLEAEEETADHKPAAAGADPAVEAAGADPAAAAGGALPAAVLAGADRTAAVPGRAECGRVEFKNVDFSYDRKKPLIQNLSLSVEPGHTVAIVGPTGAGKTTLVNLLMRFYDLQGGKITLDGVDISEMTRAELRSRVGMVLQDAFLFEGTIRENIRYGRLDATDEEVVSAAEATMVDRFVRQLPDGYDTVISENASALSSGEKQLLTIARAFIAHPKLLILDEATSSVDTRTEVQVQHAMAKLQQGRTAFVIAHRLSTIRDADLILMMRDGQIVEQGTHEELLARHGAYADLYNSQFRAASESDNGGAEQ